MSQRHCNMVNKNPKFAEVNTKETVAQRIGFANAAIGVADATCPPMRSHSCGFGYKRKKGSHNELPFINGKGGKTGIRTPDTLWRYTRFPGVPLKPLEHLSFDRLSAIWMFSHIADAKVIIIKLTIASRDAHLIYFKY